MSTTTRSARPNRKPPTAFDVSARRYLADAYDRAVSGHPKPELAASTLAALDEFDRLNPLVRDFRGVAL